MAIQTDTVEKLTGRKPLRVQDLIGTYKYVWENKVTRYADLK